MNKRFKNAEFKGVVPKHFFFYVFLDKPMFLWYTYSMKHYKTPRETSEILGISIDRLRRLAENGTISTIRTPGGQRRYDVQGSLDAQIETDIPT